MPPKDVLDRFISGLSSLGWTLLPVNPRDNGVLRFRRNGSEKQFAVRDGRMSQPQAAEILNAAGWKVHPLEGSMGSYRVHRQGEVQVFPLLDEHGKPCSVSDTLRYIEIESIADALP